MKILLNAEPFGFGPSAAIANIFNLLKNEGFIIDYIGEGLSKDLQNLDYNEIFDIKQFDLIIDDYDYFITAMDFKFAKKAINNGTKTIFYDALTWYWKNIDIKPYAYISQDFINVENNFNKIKCDKKYIVKPLLSDHKKEKEIYNVLNFGGLENHYFKIEDTIKYIENIIEPILENYNIDFILGSSIHVTALKNKYNIKTFSYEDTQLILSNTKNIFCTSGLGNIYEINKYKLNYIFLPPANDTQGQQQMIINNIFNNQNSLDWSLFGNTINYFDSQKIVMKNINNNIHSFNKKSFSNLISKTKFSKLNLDLNHNENIKEVLLNIIK